jgi:predicted aldo/keto reductase-like oxidoreductase
VLLHGIRPASYQIAIDFLYPTLIRLKEQGKFRFAGLSETDYVDGQQETASRAVESNLFDVIMLRYGVIAQGPDKRVFPKVKGNVGPGIMGMSPVRPPFCRPTELTQWLENLKIAGRLTTQALSAGDPLTTWIKAGPAALAANGIKFAAANHAVHTIVTGTANIDHLESNVKAILDPGLSPEIHNKLRAIYGALRECRPT